MKKTKKIIIYISITLTIIVMVSLFYYSMRATILDYFFENGLTQRDKVTSASGDQAQIMVDLANKQLAKQQEDNEIRNAEKTNQSIYDELDTNKATVKSPTDTDKKMKQSNLVQNGFVVVNCETGGVIACPHNDVQTGTSPLFYKKGNSNFLVGRCLDLSIDVKSFCPKTN